MAASCCSPRAARRPSAPSTHTVARLHKLVPGVPVTPIYVGNGEGEVPLKRLTKEIKATKTKKFGRGLRKGLSAADAETVRARFAPSGGPQMPVPKGIDPNQAQRRPQGRSAGADQVLARRLRREATGSRG